MIERLVQSVRNIVHCPLVSTCLLTVVEVVELLVNSVIIYIHHDIIFFNIIPYAGLYIKPGSNLPISLLCFSFCLFYLIIAKRTKNNKNILCSYSFSTQAHMSNS